MTEWEQIKREYREIPVPADGPHQMLQTIARAKQKRNRFQKLAKYGTVAAAALLVLLLPGTVLFSGGFGAKSENMYMEADCAAESTTEGGWFGKGSTDDMMKVPFSNGAQAPQVSKDVMQDASDMVLVESAVSDKKDILEMYADAISKEILRQMKERMQNEGKTYYIKGEECPEGFSAIENDQEFYINEEGLLVIVFHAGIVAPTDQGTTEFVIPAKVYSPVE